MTYNTNKNAILADPHPPTWKRKEKQYAGSDMHSSSLIMKAVIALLLIHFAGSDVHPSSLIMQAVICTPPHYAGRY
jgi:hypothetical protein